MMPRSKKPKATDCVSNVNSNCQSSSKSISSPSEPIMNDDCWLLVLDYFFGDFSTLAKLMGVSRQLQPIVTRYLYGQLDHPANRKRINNWSRQKHGRLASLLFTSCGVFKPMNPALSEYTMTTPRGSLMRIPCYQIPLGYNYFDCVRRLPLEILCTDVWQTLVGAFGQAYWETPPVSFSRLGRVLTEIWINSIQGIERWTQITNHLSQLLKITIDIPRESIMDVKGPLIKFVKRHQETFPGKLIEIAVMNPAESAMEINCLVEPTKLFLQSFKMLNDLSDLQLIRLGKNLKHLVRDFWKSQTHCKPLEPEPSSVRRFLQQCRQLQSIHLVNEKQSSEDLSGIELALFSWAPQELYEVMESQAREQRTGSNSSFGSSPSPPPSSTLVEQSSLIQLKEFIGRHQPGQILLDIMDGFRYSLEKLEFDFTSTHPNMMNHWNWSMPRLTVLKLSYTGFQLTKLQQCPVLQELTLWCCEAETQETGQWRLPNSLRVLCLNQGSVMDSLNFESLGQLQDLKELSIYYTDTGRTEPLDRVTMLGWRFPKLEKLSLSGDALEIWHRPLLRAAFNLQSFNSSNSVVFLPHSWWFETPQESVEAEAFREDNELDHRTRLVLVRLGREQPLQWNIHHSGIKSLIFTDHFSINEISVLGSLLQDSEIPVPQELATTAQTTGRTSLLMTLIETTTIKTTKKFMCGGVAFPRLSQVEFAMSSNNETSRIHRDGWEALDNVFRVLMNRPRMRQIKSIYWNPTDRFIREELEQVDQEDKLRSTKQFDSGGNVVNYSTAEVERRQAQLVQVDEENEEDDHEEDVGEDDQERETERNQGTYCILLCGKGCFRLRSQSS